MTMTKLTGWLAGALIGCLASGTVVLAQPVPAKPAIPLSPSKSTLGGRVIDEAGLPVPNATVVVFAASVVDGTSIDVRTDKDGRFTLRDPMKGPFHLAVFPRQLEPGTPAPKLMPLGDS